MLLVKRLLRLVEIEVEMILNFYVFLAEEFNQINK